MRPRRFRGTDAELERVLEALDSYADERDEIKRARAQRYEAHRKQRIVQRDRKRADVALAVALTLVCVALMIVVIATLIVATNVR